MERIIELCDRVGNQLGKGLAECVYHEALCCELRSDLMLYSKEVVLPIKYTTTCGTACIVGNVRADIITSNGIVVECKSVDGGVKTNQLPQVINYMELTGNTQGLLVNFNSVPSKPIVEYIVVTRCPHENYKCMYQDDCKKVDFLTRKGQEMKESCCL